LNTAAPFLPGVPKMPQRSPIHDRLEFQMSHAADRSASAGNSSSIHTGRALVVAVALVAGLATGTALLGRGHSAAAVDVGTPMPAATMQAAAVAGTDLSVPEASAVLSGRESTIEEASPTF
jgi:anti-sigma-K factor RskA